VRSKQSEFGNVHPANCFELYGWLIRSGDKGIPVYGWLGSVSWRITADIRVVDGDRAVCGVGPECAVVRGRDREAWRSE